MNDFAVEFHDVYMTYEVVDDQDNQKNMPKTIQKLLK